MIVSQEEGLRAEAASCVQDIAEKSKLFNKHAEEATPRFDPDECIVGKELGVGGFSVVYEIDKLNLLGGINAAQPRLRAEVASRAVKNGQARYALKRLKNATIRKSSSDIEDVQHQFVAGVADLALEVKFLAVLNHPHIIKMRGVCSAGLCSRDAFIVVDRLFETLDERIPSWRMNQRRFSGGLGLVIDSKGRKKEKLFAQRLSVAYSLSSAFEYLHSNRIVYRDLKPDNIGFDVRDDVKLFDFGLARELHCSDDNDNSKDNDIYSMSSEVGSLRYMAPEVANGQKYNHKVDVYAFGLILWQLCHLETPYEEYTFQNFRENVFEKGIRPKISKKDLSQSLRLADLQTRSWANSMSERPEFSEIREMLRDEIFKLDTSMRESDLDFSNKTEKSIAQED